MFLYLISEFTSRSTIDADYLLESYSKDINTIEKLIIEVLSVETRNDFINLQIFFGINNSRKNDAIILIIELTGRMKDFYDICHIARTFDFEGRKLKEVLYKT